MTDYSKVNLITQALEQPRYIGTDETEQLKQLLKAYPHFVPARYALAATKNRDVPLTQEALSEIYPYCGNWLQLYGYLNGRGFEARKFNTSPASEETVEANNYADEYNQMLSADLEHEKTKELESYASDTVDDEIAARMAVNEVDGTGYLTYQVEDAPVYINYFPEEPKDSANDAYPASEPMEEVSESIAISGTQSGLELNDIPETAVAEVDELILTEIPDPTDTVAIEAEPVEIYSSEEPLLREEPSEDPALIAAMIEASETDIATEPETAASEAGDDDNILEQPMTTHKHQHIEEMVVPASAEDYFTYQGIRVSAELPDDISSLTDHTTTELVEEAPAQSLMVMMSFTEWLLHFKSKSDDHKEEQEGRNAIKAMWQREKLAAIMEEEDEEIPEQVFERAVNSVAKESNLVSEALAEVYVKQHKFDKAIDMYLKLSLRDPSKNAYFAKKIEGILKDKEV